MTGTGDGSNTVDVTHIFTLAGSFPSGLGVRLEDVLELGRFTSNTRDRPDNGIRVLDLGIRHGLCLATAKRTIGEVTIKVTLWSDHHGLGQLHLSHEMTPDPVEIATTLDCYCHGRTTLRIDGVPFMEWVQREASLDVAPSLAQDVLDLVHYPGEGLDEVCADGRPTASALKIVYRNPHSSYTAAGNVHLPLELNRGGDSFAVHGRGVVLLCGHQPARRVALRMTAAELLFAIARARLSRVQLERGLREAALEESRDPDRLQELIDVVRRERIRLAVDVRAAVDGLFMPESVLDDFRASLGAALRFDQIVESSQSLANTLSDVVTSYLEEAKLTASEAEARRDRRWQLVMGVASGFTIPIALLLSYFGISSEVTAPPDAPITSLPVFWLPWLITIVATAGIVLASVLGYARSQTPKSARPTPGGHLNKAVMISAHRCGAGKRIDLENTRIALGWALDLDVEFVEFDVQRCVDGTCVLCHDDFILAGDELRSLASTPFVEFAKHATHYLCYEEVLAALSQARKRAHIDLKFTSPPEAYADPETTYEVQAVRQAVDIMGASQIIVTSLEDRPVRAVRAWARKTGVDLLVGLSIGRSRAGLTPLQAARQVLSEVFPARRYRRADANLVVAQRRLARLSSARFARRMRMPLLVWTVDDPDELRYWLKPGRAWLVTTNEPSRALNLRKEAHTSAL